MIEYGNGMLPMAGARPEVPVGDEQERCYTPLALARAAVASVARQLLIPPRVIIEPSCGDGAFVVVLREQWPGAIIWGCDIDEHAAGLAMCDEAVIGDWAMEAAHAPVAGLVMGNPPFSHAIAHLEATREHQALAAVSFILPWAYPGVGEWAPVLARHPLWSLQAVAGRPWPKKMRETGNYLWQPGPNPTGPRLITEPLTW